LVSPLPRAGGAGGGLGSPFPVIGVTCNNARRPVKLFDQHRARQHMGPGGLAKGDEVGGGGPFFGGQAVGRPDEETHFAGARIPPFFKLLGKGERRHLIARLIHRHNDRAGRNGRGLAPYVGQFGDLKGPGQALGIARDQIGLWAAADLPSGNDVKLQAPGASPNAHMRSRL
jgi:hypothetical protein